MITPSRTQTPERIAAEFDRIAAIPDSGGWNHNDSYHSFLLNQLSTHIGSALDIGCGKGTFARLLAERADRVTGIDLSPKMLDAARAESAAYPNITYSEGDMMVMDFHLESFDCIASIATLHHLPLDAALKRIKGWLKPGGTLLVLDLISTEPRYWWMDGVSILLNRFVKAGHPTAPLTAEQRAEASAAWDAHGKDDHYLRQSEVKRICADLLPGAQIKRHFFWRYSLVWTKRS